MMANLFERDELEGMCESWLIASRKLSHSLRGKKFERESSVEFQRYGKQLPFELQRGFV